MYNYICIYNGTYLYIFVFVRIYICTYLYLCIFIFVHIYSVRMYFAQINTIYICWLIKKIKYFCIKKYKIKE